MLSLALFAETYATFPRFLATYTANIFSWRPGWCCITRQYVLMSVFTSFHLHAHTLRGSGAAELWLIPLSLLSLVCLSGPRQASVVSPNPSLRPGPEQINRLIAEEQFCPPGRRWRLRCWKRIGSCAISALLTLDKSGQNTAGQDGCSGGWVGLTGHSACGKISPMTI